MNCFDLPATALPAALQRRAGEVETSATRAVRRCWLPGLLLCGCFVLASGSVASAANEGEARWRVFDVNDNTLLVITDTDEATDSFGSPLFRCKKASGTITIEGDAKKALRNAMADLLRADQYPQVKFVPARPDESALLDLSYSEAGSGWQYSFELEAVGAPVERFKSTGVLEFKIGNALVREEFKVGLENVTKFQNICKQPAR